MKFSTGEEEFWSRQWRDEIGVRLRRMELHFGDLLYFMACRGKAHWR